MANFLKRAALALALPGILAAGAPALAHDRDRWDDDDRWEHQDRGEHRGWYREDRGYHRDRGYYDGRGYYPDRGYYGEPVYARTRVWRGDDGRYYCRHSDGTTGLLIGGVAGALLGREVAGYRGDRTAGAIIGGAIGALAGKAIDSNGARCR
jgi:hypothetical protein